MPLVGRANELGRLIRLLDLAVDGRGQAVVVEGEAGIGKSRLVDAVLGQALDRGVQVFAARADEFETGRPFGAISDCLGVAKGSPDPRRAEIAQSLYGHPTRSGASMLDVGGLGSEFRLVEDMLGLTEELCALGPVAIALDDIHWADPATLLVAQGLSRMASCQPLLLILSCRASPRTPQLQRLIREVAGGGTVPTVLAPLGRAEVIELVTHMIGTRPGPLLTRQTDAAGGNPLYLTELVATLVDDGSVREVDDAAEIESVAFPAALKPIVLYRMSFLSPETREMLRLASVLGCRFHVEQLGVILGMSALTLVPRVCEAIDAGVLGDDGVSLVFRHDVLREALYEDIPRSLRASLHRDVARAMATAGAPAMRVAEQFLRGECRGDPLALEWIRRAADEATVHSPATAADVLERAIELIDPADPHHHRLLADLIVSYELSGFPERAERACHQLLTRQLEPLTDARVRLSLARLVNARGDLEEALVHAASAAAVVGLSEHQRVRVLGNRALLPLAGLQLDLTVELAKSSLLAAEKIGENAARATCAYALASVAFQRARFDESMGWLEQCQPTSDALPSARMAEGAQHLGHAADLLRAQFLLESGRVVESRAALTRLRHLTSEGGFKRLLLTTYCLQAMEAYLTGQWDDALAHCDIACKLGEQINGTETLLGPAFGVRALVAAHRGDLSAARVSVEGIATASRGLLLAEALLQNARGCPGRALELMSSYWDHTAASGVLINRLGVGPELVRLAMETGDRPRAAAVCVDVEALLAHNPQAAAVRGDALRCRGLLEDDAVLLVRATTAYRDCVRPLQVAQAAEDAACSFGRAGRLEEARALFDEAIELFEQLDASWDLARVGSRMRVLRLRRRSKSGAARPRAGWDALSPSELAVVDLITGGLSNPEIAERLFLSRNTVRFYVSSALTKLGLTTRVDLARESIKRRHGAGAVESAQPRALAILP